MRAKELIEIIESRRSVRKFLPDTVPKSDIDKMLYAASWAPSGTNQQNWFFIVVTSDCVKTAMKEAVVEKLKEVSGKIGLNDAKMVFEAYTSNFVFFDKAPVVIAVAKRPYVSMATKLFKRYKIELKSWSTADVQGPSAAVQNIILMAHALGYGSCWMTGPLIAGEKLEDVLGISAPDELMALLPIGKPAGPAATPQRKSIEDVSRYL